MCEGMALTSCFLFGELLFGSGVLKIYKFQIILAEHWYEYHVNKQNTGPVHSVLPNFCQWHKDTDLEHCHTIT